MQGYTIDSSFIIRVTNLIEVIGLPYPRKRDILTNDDEILPIITEGYWKC